MDKSTENQSKSDLLAIAEKLEVAKHELEQLAVQLSLGEVEAKDKFEDIKNEFRARLRELRQIVKPDAQKSMDGLAAKIVELETALLSGKVDAGQVFEGQKKKILALITAVEDKIVKRFGNVPAVNNFIHEAEKFKLKLEILRLRFVVKKFKIKNAFHDGMDEAVALVRTVGSGIRRARVRYRDFRDEIRQAYSHMKKAVEKI